MASHKFDFTEVFSEIGRLFVRGLSLRMRNQVGIDGARYSRPEKSTLKARQRMLSGTWSKKKGTTLGITLKGKTRKVQAVGQEGLTNVPITRLLVSRDTSARAFLSEASKDSVKVYVSGRNHLKMGSQPAVTYQDIIAWNSRDQSDVNPAIRNPPLVFPTDQGDILRMEKEMRFAQRMFHAAAGQQMNKLATLKLRKVLAIA